MRILHAGGRRRSFSDKARRRRLQQRRRKLALEMLEDRALLATLTVTTTADVVDAGDGVVSLREALAADEVAFNIPADDPGHVYYQDDGIAGQVSRHTIASTTAADDADIADIDPDWPHSWFTIQSNSGLVVSHQIDINGYTQPGASANTNATDSGLGLDTVLKIEIDASNTVGNVHALHLDAGAGSTVRGLAINGVKSTLSSIYTDPGASTPTITGNFLGTDVSGTIALGGSSFGAHIHQQGFTGGSIGGDEAADRNLIAGSQYGIYIRETHGVRIRGNLIGADRTGTDVLGLTYGVYLAAANNTLIGGVEANVRNVISTGVGFGTYISGSGSEQTRIQGNYYGTDVSGTLTLGNGIAVSERGAGTIIGGGDAADGQLDGVVAARNIIAASSGVGLDLLAIQTGATVQGNYIGADVTGTVALGNTRGIRIGHSSAGTVENQVGGTGPGEGNLISGNTYGIWMQHQSTRDNKIQGNQIGIAADGSPLGNTNDGVFFRPAYFTSVSTPNVNTIGGTAPGEGNIIAHNGRSGIRIDSNGSPSQHPRAVLSILGNSIHSNLELGIDLLERDAVNSPLAGITANDAGDADDGPNFTQNYPVLNTVTIGGGATHVEGTLNSTPSSTFRLEFFSSSAADPSGFGEGAEYLGFAEVTTDANGDVAFAVDLPVEAPPAHIITSTATKLFDHDNVAGTPLAPGETSEFSGTLVTPAVLLPDLQVSLDAADSGQFGEPLPLTLTITNNGPSSIAANTPISYSLYLSEDATIDGSDRLLTPTSSVALNTPLDAGQQITLALSPLLSQTWPDAEIVVGDVNIGVAIDVNNAIDEVDESNNTAAEPISIVHLPDLEVVSITAPPEAFLDQPLGEQLTVRIRNNGPAPFNGGIYTGDFYVSTDATITTSDRKLDSCMGAGVCLGSGTQFPSLEPGEEFDVSVASNALNVSSTIPDSNPPLGDVYIGFIVDAENSIAEANEDNNASVALPITVSAMPLPDLEVVSFTAPAEAYLDQPIGDQLTVRIRNNGPAPFNGGINTGDFYISTDATITTSDRKLDACLGASVCLGSGTQFPSLEPGEEFDVFVVSSVLNVSSTVPDSNPPLGDVYIGFIVDADDVIDEANEGNNASVALPITVSELSLPDIEAVSLDAPDLVFRGQRLAWFDVLLRNNGPGAAFDCPQATPHISTDATITADDPELDNPNHAGTICLGALGGPPTWAPGEERTSSLGQSRAIPLDAPLGHVFLGARFLPHDDLEETDLTNNAVARPVLVLQSETQAATYVNDDWAFVADLDNSGDLSYGDEVRNDNDTTGPAVTAFYGVDGFGHVTSGAFTGSITGQGPIDDALRATTTGGVVTLLEGTYHEAVSIGRDITLRGGTGDAADVVIDPSGSRGVAIRGPDASSITVGIDQDATNVLIEHLTISGATAGVWADGLTGALTMDNVHSIGNADYGFEVANTADIITTDVVATGNGTGLFVEDSTTFTDTGGLYSDNNSDGIRLEDIAGNVTLTGTTLSDNNADAADSLGVLGGDGLHAVDGGDSNSLAIIGNLLLQGVTISDSDGAGEDAFQERGIFVDGVAGSITVAGFDADGDGQIGDAERTTITGHRFDGLRINKTVNSPVNFSHADFTHNGFPSVFGLDGNGVRFHGEVQAPVSFLNVRANNNDDNGISFRQRITGEVNFDDVEANNNGERGIDFNGIYKNQTFSGNVTMVDITADDNSGDGISFGGSVIHGENHTSFGPTSVEGDLTISGMTAASTANSNAGAGIRFSGRILGDVTLGNLVTNGNSDDGVFFASGLVSGVEGSLSLTDVTANSNGQSGIGLDSADLLGGGFNAVVFDGVKADGNSTGVRLANASSFSDTNGIYSNNSDHGIWLTDVNGNVSLSGTTLNDNDADNANGGDGLHAADGSDSNSPAITGNLLLQGVTISDSDGPGEDAFQDYGVFIDGIGGSITVAGFDADGDGQIDDIERSTISGHRIGGIRILQAVNGAVSFGDIDIALNGQDEGLSGLFSSGVSFAQSIEAPVSFSNVNLTDNSAWGARFHTITGDVDFNNVAAINNGSRGIEFIGIDGNATLTDVHADGNGGIGILFNTILTNSAVTGNLTIEGESAPATATANGSTGIVVWPVLGELSIRNVQADNNTDNGIRLTKFFGLGPAGAVDSVVALDDVRADGNGDDGIEINNAIHDVDLHNVQVNNNGGAGINIGPGGNSAGIVEFAGVVATGNAVGARIADAESFTDASGDFSENSDHGIWIEDIAGNVTLTGTTISDNNADGAIDDVGDGAYLIDVGDVTTIDVESSGNQAGLTVVDADSFSDTASKFANNNDHGLALTDISGPVSLSLTRLDDNDADADGTGDGLHAADGSDLDDAAIRGALTIDGATIRDTDQAEDAAHQQRGVFVESIVGTITLLQTDLGVVGSVIVVDVPVTVSGHDGDGIAIGEVIGGSVSFSDVNSSDNAGDGVLLLGDIQGNVDFVDVTTSNNGGDGIEITDRVFGEIVFTNVTASGNDPGLRIRRAASFSDTYGVYNGNADHGIWLREIDGDVTLTGTTLNDNDADGDGIGDGLNASTDGGGLITVISGNPPPPIGGNLVILGATMIDSDDDPAPQQSGLAVEQTGGHIIIANTFAPIDIVNQTIQAGANFDMTSAAVNLLGTSIEIAGDLALLFASALSLDAGSSIAADTIIVRPDNIISGGGTLSANQVLNNGVIEPGFSPGKLTIDGHFEQGPDGLLTIEIGGPTPIVDYDVLCVTGDATFAGVVEFVLIDGYTPQPGDVFEALDVAGLLDLSAAQIVLPPELQLIGGSAVAPPVGGAVLIGDGASSGGRTLLVGGTPQNDRIILYGNNAGNVNVRLGGQSLGPYTLGEGDQVIVSGGAGDDVINVAGSVDLPVELRGEEGDDYLGGGADGDLLLGGPGDDRLTAGGGDNRLEGGDGDDRLMGSRGDDLLLGGPGDDRLFAGDGDNFVDGGAGDDQITAGSGSDLLRGSAGDDTITARGAGDILVGGDGEDDLDGGGGRDVLIGGLAADRLFGRQGEDILIGGTTTHDDDDAALLAILAEWTSNGDFNSRIANLASGGGASGGNSLAPGATVLDDGEHDDLFGGSDPDWLLAFALDQLHNLQDADQVSP